MFHWYLNGNGQIGTEKRVDWGRGRCFIGTRQKLWWRSGGREKGCKERAGMVVRADGVRHNSLEKSLRKVLRETEKGKGRSAHVFVDIKSSKWPWVVH